MKLGRIREHVAAHNWFAVGVDLCIVVLGVFLGMQVNNWNQDRLDRQQGGVYYQRIAGDLDTDIIAWQTSMDYYTSVQSHAKAALAALKQPHADLGEQFLIDAYQATQIAPRPVARGAYDEAVSRGVFIYVGDVRLRDRITNYYLLANGLGVIFDPITPYRERMRRQMPYEASAAVMAHCSDVFSTTEGGMVLIALPDACHTGLSAADISRAVAQVRAAPDLMLDLNRQISDLEQKIASFHLILDTARTLRHDMGSAPR
ncbi:MAG TPA: hypothetical protein VG841_06655 [Caulobacterales bacterium]|nr:hypothetical protein [Caulobacterales bacterium]